jgi:hypothetical protein
MRSEKMLFEDEDGRLLTSEEVDDLSIWEIEDRKLHVYEDKISKGIWNE